MEGTWPWTFVMDPALFMTYMIEYDIGGLYGSSSR